MTYNEARHLKHFIQKTKKVKAVIVPAKWENLESFLAEKEGVYDDDSDATYFDSEYSVLILDRL